MNTTKTLTLYDTISGAVVRPFPTANSKITSFRYNATRMGDVPTISATLEHYECLDEKWSDRIFANFNGEKYYLKHTPSSSYDNTSCMYKHDIELVSERVVLESVYLFNSAVQQGDTEDPLSENSSFTFFGDLSKFADLFNSSASYSNIDYRVVVDDGVASEDKLIEFQDQFLYDALKKMFEVFDVPFYFDRKVIHIGYSQNYIEEPIRYGASNALMSVKRNNLGTNFVNRVTGLGSDRNISYYYPNPTPKGTIALQVTSAATYSVKDYNLFSRKMDLERKMVFGGAGASLTTVEYSTDATDYSVYRGESITVNAPQDAWFKIGISVSPSGYIYVGGEFSILNRPTQPINAFYESSTLTDGTTVYPSYIKDGAIYCGRLPKGNYTLTVHLVFSHVGMSEYSVTARYSTRKYDYWHYIDEDVEFNLEDASIFLEQGNPVAGDTIKQVLVKRVNVQQALMPSKYRESDGRERFYNAENGEYKDELGNDIYFSNPYSKTRPREYILRDEEIYPSITGITNASGERIDEILDVAHDKYDNDEIYPEGDENAGKYVHPYFFVKLRRFDGANGFNLFEHAIENGAMTISMTSGDCGACEFTIGVDDNNKNTVQVDENGDIMYDEDSGNVLLGSPQPSQNDTYNNEVWVALKKDIQTYGVVMPNITNNIRVGVNDKFVILHIDLPEAYITAAEKRLENAIITHMAEHNAEEYSYSAKFSRVYFEENEDIIPLINENARVTLGYNGFNIPLYVTSFSYNMDANYPLPEVSIELSEKITVKKGVIEQLKESSSDLLKPQIVSISKSIVSNEAALQKLQSNISSNRQEIEDRLDEIENNLGIEDLTELKEQVGENTAELQEQKSAIEPIVNNIEIVGDGVAKTSGIYITNGTIEDDVAIYALPTAPDAVIAEADGVLCTIGWVENNTKPITVKTVSSLLNANMTSHVAYNVVEARSISINSFVQPNGNIDPLWILRVVIGDLSVGLSITPTIKWMNGEAPGATLSELNSVYEFTVRKAGTGYIGEYKIYK